jgi:hypothetical protein
VKHAVVSKDAVHFTLQVAHAASLQKRDVLGELYNSATQMVIVAKQQIEAAIGQVQRVIADVQNSITTAIGTATAELQSTVNGIIKQITNFPGCATAQTTNVQNLVNQTGMLLHKFY